MTFRITTAPPLNDTGEWTGERIDHDLIARKIASWGDKEIDLQLRVEDQVFSYYPTSFDQAIIDLEELLERLRHDGIHDVLLSGYPVLAMRVDGRTVSFHDPGPALESAGKFQKAEIEGEIRSAIGRLLAAVDQA